MNEIKIIVFLSPTKRSRYTIKLNSNIDQLWPINSYVYDRIWISIFYLLFSHCINECNRTCILFLPLYHYMYIISYKSNNEIWEHGDRSLDMKKRIAYLLMTLYQLLYLQMYVYHCLRKKRLVTFKINHMLYCKGDIKRKYSFSFLFLPIERERKKERFIF